MKDELAEMKHRSIESLKDHFEARAKGLPPPPSKPTDQAIIRAITASGHQLSEAEARADMEALTVDDYDGWVHDALHERLKAERIQMDVDGEKPEHPTSRLFRIGIESIEAGKPSPVFLELLKLIGKNAEKNDPLPSLGPFPDHRAFPKIDHRRMVGLAQSAQIAKEFKAAVEAEKSTASYAAIKEKFVIDGQRRSEPWTKRVIYEALAKHDLDYSAKPGRKPEPAKRKVRS